MIPTWDTYLDICCKGIASKALVCLDLDSQLRLDKRRHWIFCLVFASFIIWSQYWAYMDYSPHLILRFQVGDRSIGIRKTIHDVCTVVQDMLKEVEAQVLILDILKIVPIFVPSTKRVQTVVTTFGHYVWFKNCKCIDFFFVCTYLLHTKEYEKKVTDI